MLVAITTALLFCERALREAREIEEFLERRILFMTQGINAYLSKEEQGTTQSKLYELRYKTLIARSLEVQSPVGAVSSNPASTSSQQVPQLASEGRAQLGILILACDGLKDYVSETEVIGKLNEMLPANIEEQGSGMQDVVKGLMDFALEKSWDNVTIQAILIK